MNTSKSTLQSFSGSITTKACSFVVIAIILSACENKPNTRADQTASLTISDINKQELLGRITLTNADPSSVDVKLRWSASSGADLYRIERQENGAKWRVIFDDLVVLSHTDTNVQSGVSYKYRVQACPSPDTSQSTVECVVSNELEVRIPENYRTKQFPSTNVQTDAGIYQINIGITSLHVLGLPIYHLQEYKDSQYTTLATFDERNIENTIQETVHKARHENREPKTEYQYRVRTCSATETDNCYSWYSFRTTTLPSAEPVAITGEVLGATSNQITWLADTIATSYTVSRRLATDAQDMYQKIGVVPATDPEVYTDTGLDSNTVYVYVVASCTSSGNKENCSAPSNEVMLQTDVDLIEKPPLDTLAISASNPHQLTISWQAYDPTPSFYQIDVSQDGGSGWTELSNSQQQNSYVHQGLRGGTAYQYRVRACIRNESNCTPYAEQTGETPSPFTLDPTITADLVLGSGTEAIVTWESLTGVTEQRFKARKKAWDNSGDASVDMIDFGVVAVDESTKQITGLEPEKQYQFFLELCATNSACKETTSSSPWLRTYAPIDTEVVYIEPDGIQTYASHSAIQISWNYVSTQPVFYLYRRSNVVTQQTTNIDRIQQVDQDTTSLLQNSGLEPDTAYSYEVKPCLTDHQCTSNWAEIGITTDIRLDQTPSLDKVQPLGFDKVQVELTVPPQATYYIVLRKEASDQNFIALHEKVQATGSQVYVDNSVTQGATYNYKIRACRTHATNCRDSAIEDATIPYKLDGKPVFNTPSTTVTSVDLSWDYQDSHGQTPDYFVLENTIKDTVTYQEIDGGITGVTQTITSLSPATAYVARVKACLTVTEGATENCSLWGEKEYTTQSLPRVVLAANVKSPQSIDLRWTAVADASYTVHQSTGSFGSIDITNYSSQFVANYTMYRPTDSMMTVTELSTDTTYYFRVSVDKDGATSLSNEVGITPTEPIVFKKQLNDTGITFGGNYPDGDTADCVSNITAPQDCHHGRDATHNDDSDGHAGFSFTKLDSNGKDLSADASSWSCVHDNVTGLTWEVKTIDGRADSLADIQSGTSANIHHRDNEYRWGGITAIGRDDTDQKIMYYDDWNTLVNGSNKEQLCGYDNWRVPTRDELTSILDLNEFNPVLDTEYFPHTSIYYWTNSLFASVYPAWRAWVISLYGSLSFIDILSTSYKLRLVRGEQPAVSLANEWPDSRYTKHEDGIVIDTETGLMWKQCSQGKSGDTCAGTASTFTWQQALEAATSEDFAGYKDWRVPNRHELQSLIALDREEPTINESIFPNTLSAAFWSASPYNNNFNYAWLASFDFGYLDFRSQIGNNVLRLVRGGQ